jgi:glycine/D-amino acid oxidase-like deaminating enzyme
MNADIVVVGAGALGLSTALHCALAGRSVVVVERHKAGSQASGRAAGLFKSVQADEVRTILARRSIARAISFADWAGVPLDVARCGSFLVARTPRHRAYLLTEAAASRGWGADVREVPAAELDDRVSYYRGSGDGGPGGSGSGSGRVIWCPEDVYIEEPISLIQAYLAGCRLAGVTVLESEPVVAVTSAGGQVAGAETTARSLVTKVVVDAAGAWTRQVAELAGARAAVAPVRHQLLVTEPSAEIDPADPITRVVDAAVYLRPARGGLMVGGFEADPLPVDPRTQPPAFSTDDVPLDLGHLRRLAGQVAQEVPLASEAGVAELRSGLFTMSPDGRFVAGPVPDVPGLWVVSGCNGSGFSSSLAIGEALAASITGTELPAGLAALGGRALGGLAALAPGRFGALTDAELVTRGVWQYAHYYDPAAQDSG